MVLTRILQAISALRQARDGEDFVLLATGVVDGILRVLTADMIWFDDFDACTQRPVTLVLWPPPVADDPHRASKRDLGEALTWTGASGVGRALVMPLPAPQGSGRRLVFLRQPDYAFSDEDRSAAVLLQPHIADALRCQSRRAAARLLTGRQRELLRLVAAGDDNVAIARRLGLSPYTVRKHLENAFARLDVTSRTAAVAKVCPDATWLDPPPPEALRETWVRRAGVPSGTSSGRFSTFSQPCTSTPSSRAAALPVGVADLASWQEDAQSVEVSRMA